MELRILGPVEAWHENQVVHLRGRQNRLLLGILALELNRSVPFGRLVDLLWGDSPPSEVRAVLQNRISELRRSLSAVPETVVRLSASKAPDGGYGLFGEPHLVDAHRFSSLVQASRRGATTEATRDLLRDALSLWRGPVLGGSLAASAHSSLSLGLESLRMTAIEELAEAELRLGRHLEVVDELDVLAGRYPGRSRLTSQLMLALYRSGRAPEALAAYERSRRWHAEEHGIDPSEDLQALQVRILQADPSLYSAEAREAEQHRRTQAGGAGIAATVKTPHLLPADIADFTGREHESSLLVKLLTPSNSDDAVPVAAVCGPGGVGKTTLSVHVAHQLRGAYPDGQLYATLRGMSEHPMPPLEVLERFLRALGVDAPPDTVDGCVDVYRDLLATQRVLVVLDDVAEPHQVLPLIPGSPTCAVLLNSRVRLGATVGAQMVSLDIMDPHQSHQLLARIAGQARVQAEPDAASELAELCGHLPLAIRIQAANLVARPHLSVRRLTGMLRASQQRLDQFAHGQLDVRSSIAVSYGTLDSAAQMLLRRLGDLGIPEVNLVTSAALLDTSADMAEEVLEQLYDAQLSNVEGTGPQGLARYRIHDLILAFGAEQAQLEETPEDLDAARTRLFGSWLAVTDAANTRQTGRRAITDRAPRSLVDRRLLDAVLADPAAWIDSERQVIGSLVRRASRDRRVDACWGLACLAASLFETRRYFDETAPMLDCALEATQRADDHLGRGAVLVLLGILATDRGRQAQGWEYHKQAAALFKTVGDMRAYAIATTYMAITDRYRRDYDDALRRMHFALDQLQGHDDHGWEAIVARNIGQVHLELGDVDEAEAYLGRAREQARLSAAPAAEAQVQYWQGRLRLAQGRVDAAQAIFAEVLTTSRTLGDRSGEIQALRGLGRCYQVRGNRAQAEDRYREAKRLAHQPRPTLLESRVDQDIAELDRE